MISVKKVSKAVIRLISIPFVEEIMKNQDEFLLLMKT